MASYFLWLPSQFASDVTYAKLYAGDADHGPCDEDYPDDSSANALVVIQEGAKLIGVYSRVDEGIGIPRCVPCDDLA